MAKISVVTVCRNVRGDLEKTMYNVLAQISDDMEYIVVDGASTDGSVDILERCGNPKLKWVSESDRGIYDAMNKGVSLASGEWVVFMNAGDLFASDDVLKRVEAVLPALSDDTDVIYGDVVKDGMVKVAEESHNSHRMFFCHQSALTRREALLRHPFDLSHPLSADFKLYKTLLHERRRFERLPFPVAIFDTGGVSNRRRSAGLADNMRVILEVDGPLRGLPHLLHLAPTYIISRMRGK